MFFFHFHSSLGLFVCYFSLLSWEYKLCHSQSVNNLFISFRGLTKHLLLVTWHRIELLSCALLAKRSPVCVPWAGMHCVTCNSFFLGLWGHFTKWSSLQQSYLHKNQTMICNKIHVAICWQHIGQSISEVSGYFINNLSTYSFIKVELYQGVSF